MDEKIKRILRRFLPRNIHSQRILGGPLRGRRIVTSWYDYPSAILGRTERSLIDWFSRNVKNDETWFDVGAHYGYTAIALCIFVGESGRVFAFEPMLSTAGYLQQTRQINEFPQLMIIPIALGNPNVIYLEKLFTVRGMMDSTISGGDNIESFLVARLDWLWPHICDGQQQINGIKLDVQGMEIDALYGMAEVLREKRPKLVIEIHRGVNRVEFTKLLKESGYTPNGIPIDPLPDENKAQYLDDRSYVFCPC
jgi:FkbM family methyltransferase